MKSFLLAAALTVSSMAIAQSTETEEMQPPGQNQTTVPPAEDVTPPETNPTPPQPTEPAQPPEQMPPEQMPPEQMPPEQTMPTTPTTPPPTEPSTTPTPSTMAQPTMASTGTRVEPGNTKPERDARGIPVISDAATAPAGANQPVSAAPGSQVVANPNQSQVFASMAASGSYPACSRTVTDHCAQKYEHARRRRR
jgi:hypothetical protein